MFQLACVQVCTLESELSAQQDLTHQLQDALCSGQAHSSGNEAQHPAHEASSTRAQHLCLPDDEEVTLMWTSSSSDPAARIDSRASHHADQKVIDSNHGSARSPAGMAQHAKQHDTDAEKVCTSAPRRSEAGEQNVAIEGDDELLESDIDTAGHVAETRSATPGHVSEPDVPTAGHTSESDGAMDGHRDESDIVRHCAGHKCESDIDTAGHVSELDIPTAGHVPEADSAMDGHMDQSDMGTAGHKPESPSEHDAVRKSETGGPTKPMHSAAGSRRSGPQQTASAAAAILQSSDEAHASLQQSEPTATMQPPQAAQAALEAEQSQQLQLRTVGQSTQLVQKPVKGVNCSWLVNSSASAETVGVSKPMQSHRSKSPLDLVLLPAEALIAQARSKMLHTPVTMPNGMAASLGSRWTSHFCHNNQMITKQASIPGSLSDSTLDAAAGASHVANTAARACAAMLRTSAGTRTPSDSTVVTWRHGAQVIDLCLAAPKRRNKSGSKQRANENTKGDQAAALGYAQLWRRRRTAK